MKTLRVFSISFLLLLLASSGALAASSPGGLLESKLFSARFLDDNTVEYVYSGTVRVWNTRDHLQVKIAPHGDFAQWEIKKIYLYVGADPVPTDAEGKPLLDQFTYQEIYAEPIGEYQLVLPFGGAMAFQWGEPYEPLRSQNLSVHAEMVQRDVNGVELAHMDLWSFNPDFEANDELYETVVVGENTIHERTVSVKSRSGVPKGNIMHLQTGILNDMLLNNWGYFTYEMAHPKRAHFIDSPVSGLHYQGPTQEGITDESGGFDYFPEERVELWLGSVFLGAPIADHKISPLDIFEVKDTDDPQVINMARFLQSLDADGEPQGGITISPEVITCLNTTMSNLVLTSLDWGNDDQIDMVIDETIAECAALENLALAEVFAEDAKAHLDETLSAVMFRKDVSKTAALGSSKAKMNVMSMWFPAFNADDTPAAIEYFDEEGNPNPIQSTETAKPLVITYTDADPVTGAHDVWSAVSRDDGKTWKRKNLSRSADRSSFTLANGSAYPGDVKKPVFQVRGNSILVAWSSKFSHGGTPRYAIDVCPDTNNDGTPDPCDICKTVDGVETCEPDYIYDNPYFSDDIWGVAGPQRSHDYTADGFPEVGELPYSSVWVARGIVATAKNVASGLGDFEGDIVWFKPERLTSGRRDALQLFMGGGNGAGMAIVWQEDPEGVRPGKFAGPGHGWSGATTNHKTDIWYSYITLADFAKVDGNFQIGGDPEHDDPDFVGRPKALVPMSLPVRLSDNDVVNTDNLLVELGADGYPVADANGYWIPIANYDAESDGDGTHRYGYEIDGLCNYFYEFINEQEELKRVCITEDGRLLDGDTGASRANLFLQPYTKPDGTTSAWAIINYEETKGAGIGAPDNAGEGEVGVDAYLPEEGKNVIYHSFDFQNPEVASAGNIVNLPERDVYNNPLYLQEEDGTRILDYLGQPQLTYENARRARFILQGKAAMGLSRTILNIVYKEGQEGSGRPSDIMLRRVVVPTTDGPYDNPYRFGNIICNQTIVAENGHTVCVDGSQNVSTVLPTLTTDSLGDPEVDDPYGAVKVVQWEQTEDELDDPSWLNPYEDARAHRGQIRGDFVVMGYSYTPNWAAARNGNDKYDFYIRRSFDGGLTWTTAPGGSGVTHCDTFTDPLTKEKEEVCNTYAAGAFEQARNLSQLPNAKTSVIEPRIVATPGTIKNPVTKLWTGVPEDKQNQNVFYVAYGTSTNPTKDPLTGEQEDAVPMDLSYSFSQDKGETYIEDEWVVNPDSDGNYAGETVTSWGWLAKGDAEQGEVQLRMTPDGSRFYSCWLDEGLEASDIFFRRIMPMEFSVNVGFDPEAVFE